MKSIAKAALKAILPERFLWAIYYLRHSQTCEIVEGRFTYHKDGMAIQHNSDCLKEARFAEAYRLGKATGSWRGDHGEADPEWRAYVACWAARKCSSLEGDFVECGVNRGGLSRAVMHYISFSDFREKRFFLLDTYRGTPAHSLSDGEKGHNKYGECYEDVLKTFSEFQNAVILRGEVPGTLEQVPSRKVCYLSIDMNAAAPEIAAAEFFWEKLVPGAVMVLDDYGGLGYETQKSAFDKFALAHGVQVLHLPTGQGLIFKP